MDGKDGRVRKSTMKGKQKMAATTLTPEILRAAAAVWGQQGGKIKSPAKTKAARENGKLGGRKKAAA